jgi:eukaryotic-like serine/threonine-protein kinase
VPPADPFRKIDPAATGSRGQQSVPGGSANSITGNSTVTQELELVYWKDVKESADPQELEGFLDKFPGGIYADLARRRLRKLAGGSSPDQTILSGPAQANREQDLEPTRLLTPTLPAGPVGSGTEDFLRTVLESCRGRLLEPTASDAAPTPTSQATPAAATAAAAGAAASEKPVVTMPAAPAAPVARKRPVAVLAGLGALVMAAAAALLLLGRGGPEPATADGAAALSAPALPAAAPVVLTAAPPVAAPAKGIASEAHTGAAAHAGAAAHGSTAGKARHTPAAVKARAPVAAPPVEAAQAPPVAAPPRQEPRPVVVPVVAAPSPVEVCRDKVFLSREFCLAEKCDKPGARNHPLCVQRRAEIKLREESRIRN